MNFKHLIYIGITFTVVLISACAKDRVVVSDGDLTLADCTDSISFTIDVMPIVEQNCSTTDCHDLTASGGYTFTTYEQISENSEIMKKAMKHKPGFIAMPLDFPKLDDNLIRKFECWTLQGSLNN